MKVFTKGFYLMSLAAATGLMEMLFTKMERTAGRTGWRE